jgi:hypothetical protein
MGVVHDRQSRLDRWQVAAVVVGVVVIVADTDSVVNVAGRVW